MKLIFGSDHAGFNLRKTLVDHAKAQGHEVIEVGAESTEAYDYPDAADIACEQYLGGGFDFGILVCGSGIGIEMRANKHPGIRAANCINETMASLSRSHNHANFLCVGERLVDAETGKAIFDTFLAGEPDMAERHQRRVGKISGPSELNSRENC